MKDRETHLCSAYETLTSEPKTQRTKGCKRYSVHTGVLGEHAHPRQNRLENKDFKKRQRQKGRSQARM